MSQKNSPELIDPPAAAELGATAPPFEPSTPAAQAPTAPTAPPGESHRAHTRRMAHRTRLHLYAVAAIALLVYVVALATTNTHRVRVDWVFAHSTLPLVWLTLFAAIIGWLLGTLITLLVRMRTRAPRRGAVGAQTQPPTPAGEPR
jgi:uncharacterized integral membrane protein